MKKIALLLILMTLLISACGGANTTQNAGSPTDGATSGGTVRRALASEPTSLDPHGAAGAGQNAILPYLFDTLVYRDHNNEYKPYLAESWQVAPDGKTITFKLKPGIRFHDGSPLDAEAVRFTFQRIKDQGAKSPSASGLSEVERIEALDVYSVRFVFSNPSSAFFSTLSTAYAGIVSPSAVEKLSDKFGQQPVGSGAFKFTGWQPGESITLERNPDYAWAPPVVQNSQAPHLEKLVFKVLPDVATQLAAFQAGEVDILFINQPAQIASLKGDANAHLEGVTLNSLIYLSFNCQKAPFDRVEVRQALSRLINKDELVQTALGGVGETAFAPLAPTLPGFDPGMKQYAQSYDVSQAAALLEKAGYTRQADGSWLSAQDAQPLEVELLISTRPPNEALATVIQSQFKAAGIPLTIRPLESTAAMETATQGDYGMMLWRYDWNDADVLNIYLGSSRIGRTNRSFYSNPQLDELLAQAGREIDAGKRAGLYAQAQQIILSDAPWQPLYIPKDFMVMRSSLKSVVIGPMGRLLLNDATY